LPEPFLRKSLGTWKRKALALDDAHRGRGIARLLLPPLGEGRDGGQRGYKSLFKVPCLNPAPTPAPERGKEYPHTNRKRTHLPAERRSFGAERKPKSLNATKNNKKDGLFLIQIEFQKYKKYQLIVI
jgi:hypothetical protein